MKTSLNGSSHSNALWLGAAAIAVCGAFLAQYYSIKAFPMTNDQLKRLVTNNKAYMSSHIIAVALAVPPLFAMYSMAIFIYAGYAFIASTFGSSDMACALVPFSIGVLSILVALVIGEILGHKMSMEVS